MNRLIPTSIAATAAAALSGGAALTLSGGGADATKLAQSILWGKPIATAAIARPAKWMPEGRRGTIWRERSALLVAEASPCSNHKGSTYRIFVPLADPNALGEAGAVVSVRYHLEIPTIDRSGDASGWIRGELIASLAGGSDEDAIVIGAPDQQFVTLSAPSRALRAHGGADLTGTLSACTRGAGHGSLHLDSVEISA